MTFGRRCINVIQMFCVHDLTALATTVEDFVHASKVEKVVNVPRQPHDETLGSIYFTRHII